MEFENSIKFAGTTCYLKPLDKDGYFGGSLQLKTYSQRDGFDFKETTADIFLTKDDYYWAKANGIEELMPIIVGDHRKMVRANECSKRKYYYLELECQLENWIPKSKNGSPNLKKKKNIFVCRKLKSIQKEKSDLAS